MVHLGFLMVGHTHEYVDAMFSRFLEGLRSSCVFTFCQLMDAFIESSCFSPIPYLMQAIPNFKCFIKGYICDGADASARHKKPLQFHFFCKRWYTYNEIYDESHNEDMETIRRNTTMEERS